MKITIEHDFATVDEATAFLGKHRPTLTLSDAECELVRYGHVIAGVRAYRNRTGATLKDAIHAVDTEVPKAERARLPGAVEPTWTGSDGTTHLIRHMPDTYLRNALSFAELMGEVGEPGSGLANAIREELERRGWPD